MPIGATMAAASAVGGIASAVGASNAAKTQASAANRSADMQLGMFNTIRSDLSPYRGVGTSALPIYSALLGLPSAGSAAGAGFGGAPDYSAYVQNNPDLLAAFNAEGGRRTMDAFGQEHWASYGQNEFTNGGRAYSPYGAKGAGGGGSGSPYDPASIQAALAQTPGYQFALGQGEQAVTNKLAPLGLGGLSGSLGKGLARFVTGLADSTYGEQVKRYSDAVGMGQSAANQTGAFGTSATQGAAGSLIGGANASAAGTLGVANAIGGIGQGASNGYLTSKILGMYGGGGGSDAGASFASNYANAPEFY